MNMCVKCVIKLNFQYVVYQTIWMRIVTWMQTCWPKSQFSLLVITSFLNLHYSKHKFPMFNYATEYFSLIICYHFQWKRERISNKFRYSTALHITNTCISFFLRTVSPTIIEQCNWCTKYSKSQPFVCFWSQWHYVTVIRLEIGLFILL